MHTNINYISFVNIVQGYKVGLIVLQKHLLEENMSTIRKPNFFLNEYELNKIDVQYKIWIY